MFFPFPDSTCHDFAQISFFVKNIFKSSSNVFLCEKYWQFLFVKEIIIIIIVVVVVVVVVVGNTENKLNSHNALRLEKEREYSRSNYIFSLYGWQAVLPPLLLPNCIEYRLSLSLSLSLFLLSLTLTISLSYSLNLTLPFFLYLSLSLPLSFSIRLSRIVLRSHEKGNKSYTTGMKKHKIIKMSMTTKIFLQTNYRNWDRRRRCRYIEENNVASRSIFQFNWLIN